MPDDFFFLNRRISKVKLPIMVSVTGSTSIDKGVTLNATENITFMIVKVTEKYKRKFTFALKTRYSSFYENILIYRNKQPIILRRNIDTITPY